MAFNLLKTRRIDTTPHSSITTKCLLRWQWTARIREWNVLAKKTYLWRTGFADKTKEEIFATYWIAPKGEEDGLETLEDLLLRHWATLNTPAEDLPGIIVYWAGIVAAEVPILLRLLLVSPRMTLLLLVRNG